MSGVIVPAPTGLPTTREAPEGALPPLAQEALSRSLSQAEASVLAVLSVVERGGDLDPECFRVARDLLAQAFDAASFAVSHRHLYDGRRR